MQNFKSSQIFRLPQLKVLPSFECKKFFLFQKKINFNFLLISRENCLIAFAFIAHLAALLALKLSRLTTFSQPKPVSNRRIVRRELK